MATNRNSTDTKALLQRQTLQSRQTLNFNSWIFDQIDIHPSDDVLELCCGVGTQTQAFINRLSTGRITAVDINSESLDQVRITINSDRAEFVTSDIDDVENYANETYDIIFCCYGFYYSRNPNGLFEELRSFLNDGGRFILVGPVKGNNEQIFRVVREIGCPIEQKILYSSEAFMLDQLANFLSSFSKVYFSRVTNRVDYDSASELLEYWRNTTFYSPGHDHQFLNKCYELYPDELSVTKSIAYLEGI